MAKKTQSSQTRPSASANPIPAKLFRGQSVCLTGRFGGSPDKNELITFLKKEGATIAPKLNSKVDLLIVVDDKPNAAEKQAKKLNAAGASIRVAADLASALPIWDVPAEEIIRADGAVKRIATIPRYFFNERCFEVRQQDFADLKISGSKGKEISQLMFVKCDFSKTRFENTHFRSPTFGSQVFETCTFESAQLENVYIDRHRDCTFDTVTGTNVEWLVVNDCVLKNCNFRNTHWQCMSRSEIVDSTIDGAGGYTLTDFLAWSKVTDSVFSHSKFDDTSIRATKFTNTKFSDGEFHEVHFVKCDFTNVEFRGLRITELLFDDCKLKDCTFTDCTGSHIDFGNSKVTGCKMQGASLGLVQGNAKQLAQVAGLTAESGATDITRFPLLRRLAEVMIASTRLFFSVKCKSQGRGTATITADRDWSIRFECTPSRGKKVAISLDRDAKKNDLAQRLLRLVRDARASDCDAASLTIKTAKCPLKAQDLKQLIADALHEAIGKEPAAETDLAAATQDRRKETTQLRKQLLAELTSGDVQAFNKHTKAQRKQASPFKKAPLAGLNLSELNAAGLDLASSDLSKADLRHGKLMTTVLRNANLSGCNLQQANLKGANLRGADLSGADLSQANLKSASMGGTVMAGTNFEKADLSSTDLRGADFSSAKLSGANLKGSTYDEKTRWPKTFKTGDLKPMVWVGGGQPPHERTQNKKAAGPLDFEQFMARLNQITDSSRLSKATKMLKADRFQLFTNVDQDSVAGVVKSQSDSDLVYSCMLNADGNFACCTQNLNPCGGLRGALCKHLLVLIVGLTKSGELDASRVDDWINSSKIKKPNLDKDAMSEILLKYKGAEAGEVDWRPTETIPEDYFTF